MPDRPDITQAGYFIDEADLTGDPFVQPLVRLCAAEPDAQGN
jgi:hypothetical protein